ncbi:MAG TPA: FGGY-family carbohydrate kinase, partial [Acidimicrobiia bacterium]
IASVVGMLSELTGTAMSQLAIVGGGARVQLLQDLLAARTGLPVIKGSSEATALGNAVAQGIALGRFDDLVEARNWLDTAR